MMMAIVAIVLMFVLVIGLHEMGHALAARWFGVTIERIGIGFGKTVLTWRSKSGIKWCVGLLPLGGYVQLLNTRIHPVPEQQHAACFDKKSPWIRCLILLAGGLMNILVAWLALTLACWVGYREYAPVISDVAPKSVAFHVGFRDGDQIVAINSQSVRSWQQASMGLINVLGQQAVRIRVVDSAHQPRERVMDLRAGNFVHGKGSLLTRLGIKPRFDAGNLHVVQGQTIFSAVQQAWIQLGSLLWLYLVVIKQLLSGLLPFSMLLGPLGLFVLTIETFAQGFSAFMLFLGSLSLAVGLVNYSPVPGLDGGSILYTLFEKIRGKPLSVAAEVLLYRLAMIALVILLVQLVLNDVVRYFITN